MPAPHCRKPASAECGQRIPVTGPKDGQRGEGAHLTPNMAHKNASHAPPGTACRHVHGVQRRLPRAGAVGLVMGSHTHTSRARQTRAKGPDCPPPPPPEATSRHPGGAQHPAGHARQRDSAGFPHPHSRAHSEWAADPGYPAQGRPVDAERLTPDAPHNGQRSPPGATSPLPCGGQHPPPGTHAKGLVRGPHTCTPAPTASGQRTWSTPAKDGQRGEGQRLTPDAPRKGASPPPPPGNPSSHPHSAQRRLARAQAVGWVIGPHAVTTRDRKHGQWGLAARSKDGRLGEGERLTPDAPPKR